MELKKQFVLVPPMTEPLNKLNEVYENNSEENAEVSIIDDLRELNQFVAITGQCLVVFSNPKKCANFLQENKTIISKSHCKIILISPLDIPAATLAKFKKAGLTESILESSPPKKIIYKISLQLRSLKTNQLEVAKDQLVKSLIDTNPISSTKAEIISNSKIKNETASADENDKIQVPAKEKKEVKERDIFQNLKGKTNFKEESIDTKWKTQRDTLDLKLEKSNSSNASETKEPEEKFDNFLHGKSDASGPEIINTEENWEGKVSAKEEAIVEKIVSKFEPGLNLDIDPAQSKKQENNSHVEEETTKSLKRTEEIELDIEKSSPEKTKSPEKDSKRVLEKKEIEKAEDKKEQLPKKREPLRESIGGFLKGKFSKNENIPDEKSKSKEAIELKEETKPVKKKIAETVLDIFGEMKAKKAKLKEEKNEKERKAREASAERLNGHYKSKEDGSVEQLNTTQFGSYFLDESKKIETYETKERKISEKAEEKPVEKKKDKIDLGLEDPSKPKKTKEDPISNADEENEKAVSKVDESVDSNNEVNDSNNEQDDERGDPSKKERRAKSLYPKIELDLIDGEKSKSTLANENEKKIRAKRETTPYEEQTIEQNIHEGKVDRIDKYLRSPGTKKEEQDWSKIKKSKTSSLHLEKSKKIKNEEIINKSSKEFEEQIIDYRKIKEAFTGMGTANGSGTSEKNANSTDLEEIALLNREKLRMNEIVLDTKGFDFAIRLLNQIYARDYKASDLYEYLTKELINTYRAYPVYFTYDPNTEKFNAAYNSIEHKEEWGGFDPIITDWWKNISIDEANLHSTLSKNMTYWNCRSLTKNHAEGNSFWEDTQLPSWASQELSDKMVELVYPYYDGLDHMGTLLICFPFGVEAHFEYNYYTIVEMARAAQMEHYYKLHKKLKKDDIEDETSQKKSGFLDNLFGRKKTG